MLIIFILIVGGCYLGFRLLMWLFNFTYLYEITEAEFNEYKKLKHQFSNNRLENLHQNLLKSVHRLEMVIALDEDKLDEVLKDEADNWKKNIDAEKKILEEFKAMLSEVEREISARIYFNAQR